MQTATPPPQSPQDLADGLKHVGYLPGASTALVSYLAIKLGKPVLVEGPAGVGGHGSGASSRICVCLWGVVGNTDTSEFAVDGVHLDHDGRGLRGGHARRAAERGQPAHDPRQPTELGSALLLSGLVEHGDRVSTVDEHQSADPPGVLSGVSHCDRGARRPPDEDRAFDTRRVDDPSDVVDRRPMTIGRRLVIEPPREYYRASAG